VSTEDCADPDAAVAPISGTLKVGTVVPLSGGTAALAFAPVAEGMKAYVDYANENNLIPGVTLELEIGDDQYNKDLTPTAVNDLLDGGVQAFTGIVGTDGNLAVRDTLNEECVPQIQVLSGSPSFKDAENYPWTTPQLAPYDVETKVYAKQLAELFPEGVTVGLYHVNTEFGLAYADTLKEVAAEYGIEIVEEQTIEPTETAPPTAQLNALAASGAEAIIAVLEGRTPDPQFEHPLGCSIKWK
jgi:ABC-type branched-subunit amino acid transport system substrate-binding protein